MKRLLKILAVAAIAVAAAIACVFVGCNNSGKNESSADYNFTIVYEGGAKDGQAVNGQTDGGNDGKVALNICLPDGGCIPLPQANIYPDASGKLSLSQAQVNEMFSGLDTVANYKDSAGNVTRFTFHAIGVVGYKHDCEIEVNGKGNYTLKVVVS